MVDNDRWSTARATAIRGRRGGIRVRVLALALPLFVTLPLALRPADVGAASQTSCDDPLECKTISVDASGALTSPTTTGTVTIGRSRPDASVPERTAHVLVDVIETLGDDHTFVGGSYHMAFASPCAHGTATSGTYGVTGGSSTYPHSPPATSGTLPTVTGGPGGEFQCSYTLTYPAIDGSNDSRCGSHICAVRNDIFVSMGTTAITAFASASAKAPSGPPPSVPEAPTSIAFAVAGFLALTGVVVAGHRRRPGAVGPR